MIVTVTPETRRVHHMRYLRFYDMPIFIFQHNKVLQLLISVAEFYFSRYYRAWSSYKIFFLNKGSL